MKSQYCTVGSVPDILYFSWLQYFNISFLNSITFSFLNKFTLNLSMFPNFLANKFPIVSTNIFFYTQPSAQLWSDFSYIKGLRSINKQFSHDSFLFWEDHRRVSDFAHIKFISSTQVKPRTSLFNLIRLREFQGWEMIGLNVPYKAHTKADSFHSKLLLMIDCLHEMRFFNAKANDKELYCFWLLPANL